MKKLFALVLTLVMLLGLAACAPADKKEEPKAEKQESPKEETKAEKPAESKEETKEEAKTDGRVGDVNGDGKIIVGYISKNIVDPFHAPLNEAAAKKLDELVKDGTIDEWTGILDGETDPSKQVDRASECVTKKCDYVIILPAESAASDPAVKNMAEAGIKVVVVNSMTESTEKLALCYIGSDDVQAGEMLADWVVKQVPDGGKYAHCQGIIGNSAQIQRGEGIAKVMDKNDKFESVGDFPCDWQADKASNVAQDQMSKYGKDLVAIICDNDDMSSAAQKAVNNADRKDIVCVGVDGNQGPLQMVKDGEMGATVLQDGVGQVLGGIDAILACLKGETPEKVTMIPFVLVTSENVDQYLKK